MRVPLAAKIAFVTAGASRRHGRLADAADGLGGAFEDLDVDQRRLRHAHDLIVVEVRLLHAPACDRDLAQRRRTQREDHAALELGANRIGIHGHAAVDRA